MEFRQRDADSVGGEMFATSSSLKEIIWTKMERVFFCDRSCAGCFISKKNTCCTIETRVIKILGFFINRDDAAD